MKRRLPHGRIPNTVGNLEGEWGLVWEVESVAELGRWKSILAIDWMSVGDSGGLMRLGLWLKFSGTGGRSW